MSWFDDLLGKTIMLNDTILPDRKIARFVQEDGASVVVEDNPSTQDGLGSTDIRIGIGASGSGSVTTTTNLTQAMNGARIDNQGASGAISLNLPASATVGTTYYARVMTNNFLKFVANVGQTIQLDALLSNVAGNVGSDYVGASIACEYRGNSKWFCWAMQGPWDKDVP